MLKPLSASLVAVATASVLLVSPASAAKPEVVVEERFDDVYDLPAEFGPCGVELEVREVGAIRVTDYFDNEGNFVRAHVTVSGTVTLTSDSGHVVDRYSWSGWFDQANLTFAQSGNVFNVHGPGGTGGVLVNDSSRIVFDETTGEAIVINGPHQAWFGEFDDLCAVLAPA